MTNTAATVAQYSGQSNASQVALAVVIFAVLLGLIPAVIAKDKGYDFFVWWVFGALLFIVALIAALLIRPNQAGVEQRQAAAGYRKCPQCAEMVRAEAKVCRFCRTPLDPLPESHATPPVEVVAELPPTGTKCLYCGAMAVEPRGAAFRCDACDRLQPWGYEPPGEA